MKLFRRDPAAAIAAAEAEAARTRAEIERARQLAELRREQAAADRAARIAATQAEEAEQRRRAEQRRADRQSRRAARRAKLAAATERIRPVLPLLLINGGAAYAQAAYAAEHIAPATWNTASKVTFAVAFAAALETIAVYVQWHAHDALLLKAYGTAARLRRASWGIAAVVAGINYAHFADGIRPTAAALAFGLLSLLSPWLWGLHTRRVQHVQLLAEDADLIDDAGVEFSPVRRRTFPIRTWAAARWALDHGVRDPRRAWEGYNADRQSRRAARRRARAALPAGRIRTATAVLTGQPLTAREVAGLDTVPADVRALCDSVIAQARAARAALTTGAAATITTAIPMASAPATPMATRPTPLPADTGHSDGHQAGHRGGHDDDDLMAMIVATREERPVAIGMASRSGQIVASEMATPDGQAEPATVASPVATAVATAVAAEVATPRGQRVTSRVAKPASSHDRIKAIARRKPKATDAEIAKAAGVSVTTVRRALGKKKS